MHHKAFSIIQDTLFTGIILCVAAFISACEELVITIKGEELIHDCKGILCGKFKIYKEEEVVQR